MALLFWEEFMPFHRMCVSARSNVFKAGISVLGLSFGLALSAGAACAQEVIVGLVTKTEVNPFFVKMRQAAEARAKEKAEADRPRRQVRWR